MRDSGLIPDDWQQRVLESVSSEMGLLCTRQAGKSTVTGSLAVKTALLEPDSLTLLLSPTQRQSGELFRDKVMRTYDALGRPVKPKRLTATELQLSNGSRIVSLPENESGIRGFSKVALLVIDEASRVADDLYRAVRPMLAVSGGRLIALSTPYGKRGWFYDEWEKSAKWQRVKVKASMCPRIDPAFLVDERKSLGERWFKQEYECSFEDAIDAVFSRDDIDAAMRPGLKPLWDDDEA